MKVSLLNVLFKIILNFETEAHKRQGENISIFVTFPCAHIQNQITKAPQCSHSGHSKPPEDYLLSPSQSFSCVDWLHFPCDISEQGHS